MEAIWKRIHIWLDANAPTGYGHLRPGASVEAIRAAEDAMGLKLPDDVKGSYRIHDGQDKEPGLIGGEGWRMFSIQEIVQQWGRWSRANPEDARFVPIAWGEARDYVFLNVDPGGEAAVKLMIQRRDGNNPAPLELSFRSWLEGFADQLKDGKFAYSKYEGCLMYTDEIDFD